MKKAIVSIFFTAFCILINLSNANAVGSYKCEDWVEIIPEKYTRFNFCENENIACYTYGGSISCVAKIK